MTWWDVTDGAVVPSAPSSFTRSILPNAPALRRPNLLFAYGVNAATDWRVSAYLVRVPGTDAARPRKAPPPRLLAISDLHVGHPKNRALVTDIPPGGPGDWLLVAGDVGERFADIEWALGVLASRYERVVWVPGNHELWSRRADPVGARGVERYSLLIEACQRLGIVTPQDPYPVWDGPAEIGAVTIAPLFVGYDYSFLPDGASSKPEGLAIAERSGIISSDERLLHPDPYPSREEWCRARVVE